MIKLKTLITCMIVIHFCFSLSAEKRWNPIPMSELTNPDSPSYVPIPYPKNEKEVLVDLEYALKKYFLSDEYHLETIANEKPYIFEVVHKLLKAKTEFKIGKVIKVESRCTKMNPWYTWLILVTDETDAITSRMVLWPSGIYAGSSSYPEKSARQYFVMSEDDVFSILSKQLEMPIKREDVKKMKQVAFDSHFGSKHMPLWEIKMADGSLYYYSDARRAIMKAQKKIKLKDEKTPDGRFWTDAIEHPDFILDTVNDEMIMLEKVKK